MPVVADPLPDDPAALIDVHLIAAALRRAIAEKKLSLAPKVSVVVDGGGGLGLDALSADIRLRAVATAEGPKLHFALAGDAVSATPLGTIAQDEAVDAVLTLLTLIAARGPEARAADVLPMPAGSRSANATATLRPRSGAIGRHALKDATFALGLGLAFGHARAETLAELARTAKTNGADWARPAPDRALLLGPLGAISAAATQNAAEKLGFIVDAADPRRRIAACPGAPACAHGLIAARALAAELARLVPLPAGGIAVHISGCAKGCAHQKPAPLTVVGTAQGCGIVRDGTAQSTPSAYILPADLVSELDRIVGKVREAAHA